MIKGMTDFMRDATARGHVIGTWGFNSNRDFTKVGPEETNVWFFEQVFNFLRSFFGLVLPDNMELITYNATQHLKKENLEQQTFLDELMLMLKNLKEPLWTFRLNLNIVGFLRTHHSPDQLVRVQIQEPCSFICWGGPDETGFQNFNISYTLFNEGVMEGTDEMIWSVNQPILEKALRKWENQTGQMITSIDSNVPGGQPAFRHGFKRPAAPPRRRPAPPPGARRPAPPPGAPGARPAPPPGARPVPHPGAAPATGAPPTGAPPGAQRMPGPVAQPVPQPVKR